jgi:nucleoside transporter
MTQDNYRPRLSALMFGQFLIFGSWSVTLATYLMTSPLKGGLNFPPSYVGWIYSTTAIAGIVAPLFIGLLADRLFAAEKLMIVLHLLGATLLGAAAWWCSDRQPLVAAAYRAAAASVEVDGQTILEAERRFIAAPDEATPEQRRALKEGFECINQSPEVAQAVNETFVRLFLVMFVYAFCNIITLTLCNVIVFRNLRDPQHSFGQIRFYGTLGWIFAGVSLEVLWNTISADPLRYAAGLSVALGLICFWAPSTPPSGHGKSLGDALGLPALSMFRAPAFGVLIACVLGIAAVQQFYSVYTNRFLTELHVPSPAAVQTIGQVSEAICMVSLPFAIYRLGLKATMALGLMFWLLRNVVFASDSPAVVVLLGLPLHGLSYGLFVVVASIYVDRQAPAHLRASAQGIFTFVSLGVGPLLGNWLSARVVESRTIGDVVAWRTVWLTPAIISAGVLMAYLTLFRETKPAAIQLAAESG